ncbi:MAG: hypothetical protein AAGI69_20055 [Cyanobacteria bacterium P01_H01_bin.21]
MTDSLISTPKIRGYVATECDRTVFLYRRSNKITYLILLEYKKERFNLDVGSRFYGRIYPNRCDLSPDGKYFLYFAMGKSQQQYEKKLYCWTGLCSPPKIKAELLFAHGDTWGGGGRFINDRTIFIAPGMYPDFDKTKDVQFHTYRITFSTSPEYEYNSWASGNGWTISESQIDPKHGPKYPIPKVWTKTNGRLTLCRFLHYKDFLKSKDGNTVGSYDLHSYSVKYGKQQTEYSLDRACKWADFDASGRLMMTVGSQVFIYKNVDNLLKDQAETTFDFEDYI